MMEALKFKISSLGCRLNQSEIQSVVTRLIDGGLVITEGDDADIIIVNSCVVTLHSERKTRKLIYRAQRSLSGKKNALIIVTGCAARELEKVRDILYVPNDYKYLIPHIILDPSFFNEIDPGHASRFGYDVPVKATTTRINLKIQDGCDNYCSYCIIPTVRGEPQSKPFDQTITEFRKLIDAGYREIVISGVMIGQYRHDGKDLDDLLEAMQAVEGSFRIHLSSLSPLYLSARLIDLMTNEKMVKHLHLSLQSGSDPILEKMNRRYTSGKYLQLTDELKKKIPLINLTTDVITGFPGETERDFMNTLELIRRVGFSHIHTFRYSSRPGTAAALLGETVGEKIKNERSEQIIALYREQKREYYGKFNGTETVFLSERYRKGVTGGFNEYYVPVELKRKVERNRFYRVRVYLDHNKLCLNELCDTDRRFIPTG